MAFDDSKLQALREKFGDGHGGDIFDPAFRKVADKIFSKSGTRLAPYAGVPTFLSAPHMPVEAEDAGTVSEVRCQEGQSVQEGDVLVVLE